MLSFAPEQTRVVLIGTSKFPLDPRLPELPGVENNIAVLSSIFLNPEIVGLAPGSVEVILNAETAPTLLMKVRQIARQATDTFIVYYAGHGLKAPSAKGLFLAVTQTTEDDCFLNGVEFERLRQLIAECPAPKRILLLDCCFSGEATQDEMGTMSSVVTESIDIRGTYSMASSPAHRLSVAPVGARFTAFSGHLISILESGIEAASDTLTLDDIYDELRRRIRKDPNLPEPQRRVEMDGNHFRLARNIARRDFSAEQVRRLTEAYEARLQEALARAGAAERQVERMAAQVVAPAQLASAPAQSAESSDPDASLTAGELSKTALAGGVVLLLACGGLSAALQVLLSVY